MADWTSLSIQVPGEDLLEPVRNVLETLLIFLDVLKAILNTIKVFLIDFGNPIRALVEALIKIIEELFLALKTTGVGALYHIPNPIPDPNFDFHRGYDAFPQVFKQSLFDTKDFNRPQPRSGSTRGGYVLLMVQAQSPYGLLAKVRQLLKFFSKSFSMPRFEEPKNFKVTPVGGDGDPILAVADMFSSNPINQVQLSWTLPTSAETPDVGFSDLISRVSSEFVPPKFLIERSTINPASEILNFEDIKDPSKAGRVEVERKVPVAGSTSLVTRKDFLRDEYGELVVKFRDYTVLDQTSVTAITGQLGTFRYLDTVDTDKTYYYRVRAFAGDLKLTDSGQIDWGLLIPEDNRALPSVRWPSASKTEDAEVMSGKPTGTLSIRIPEGTPENFDVVENLKRVLRTAFSNDFHREDVFGTPAGTASLINQAGPVGGKDFSALRNQLDGLGTQDIVAFETVNGPITYPWEEAAVRRQSARLADAYASGMLEAGGTVLTRFRELMQSNNPLLGENTLEAAVFKATGGQGEGPGGTSESLSTSDKAAIFTTAFSDQDYRQAVLEVVNFLKAFTGTGVSPDWLAVNPLRDIIPWSGQILYDLLDKIQSLLDAFSGVTDEIQNFIDLLTRKIATLERTLEFLISILDLIASLEVGAFVLAVPDLSGDVVEWADALDSADNAPPSGPGGYSAGVALAYVAPDITAFKTAFSIIFGI